jgi:hypothetical protein
MPRTRILGTSPPICRLCERETPEEDLAINRLHPVTGQSVTVCKTCRAEIHGSGFSMDPKDFEDDPDWR